MKKKVSITIIVLLIILFIFLMKIMRDNISITSEDGVAFTEMELKDNKLTVKGSFTSSSTGYKGYSYEIEDHALYLSIQGVLVSEKYPYGEFEINISDEQLEKVTQIYLKEGKAMKQIYSK